MKRLLARLVENTVTSQGVYNTLTSDTMLWFKMSRVSQEIWVTEPLGTFKWKLQSMKICRVRKKILLNCLHSLLAHSVGSTGRFQNDSLDTADTKFQMKICDLTKGLSGNRQYVAPQDLKGAGSLLCIWTECPMWFTRCFVLPFHASHCLSCSQIPSKYQVTLT